MPKTSIAKLAEFGQSIWLDNINRLMIKNGRLKEMVISGLRGMTSNPTIFDKAISSSNDYDEKIIELRKLGSTTFQIYDDLTIRDVQDAADIFLPIYKKTDGLDGYVSLEINPELAYNAEETIKEGQRLSRKVNRPNVMFKVPSTREGFDAIEELVASGLNINITLIFSQDQYHRSAKAYLSGIKRLLENKGDISKVCSVASVFVSRIDTQVDRRLDELVSKEEDQEKKREVLSLKGKAAVANSALIYKKHLEIFSSDESKELQKKGLRLQRVLWGSTGTKNPAYSDIKYVTELIAKDTVNTLPDNTLQAFLDHGQVKEALTSEASEYKRSIEALKYLGIDINDICAQLLQDGVAAFKKSFASLLNAIEQKKGVLCERRI